MVLKASGPSLVSSQVEVNMVGQVQRCCCCHCAFIFVHCSNPHHLINADNTAVKSVRSVVLCKLIFFPIEFEFAVSNSVCHPANDGTKVGILLDLPQRCTLPCRQSQALYPLHPLLEK